MKTYTCPSCHITIETNKPIKILTDKARVIANKKAQDDYDKEKKKKEADHEKFWKKYNSYQCDYKNKGTWKKKSFFSSEMVLSDKYSDDHNYDHFMWEFHHDLWNKKHDHVSYGIVWGPWLNPTRYHVCEACKAKIYI